MIFSTSALIRICTTYCARRVGVEVTGMTVDRTIRVQFLAYPHPVWALRWQGGKRRLRTSWCPCLGRLGTLKTPSCPWRWVPGSRSEFGNWTTVSSLYRWNIAKCDLKPQLTNQLLIAIKGTRLKCHWVFKLSKHSNTQNGNFVPGLSNFLLNKKKS